MTMHDWKEKSDKELCDNAQSGFGGLGYVVESVFRLRDAVVKTNDAANRLSKSMFLLTIALLVIAVVQVVVVVWA